MWTFSRILCRFGRHHRSRGQARRIEDGWRSRCRRCGSPMVKLGEDDWMIEPTAAQGATEAEATPSSVTDASADALEAPPASRRRWPFARRRRLTTPAAD